MFLFLSWTDSPRYLPGPREHPSDERERSRGAVELPSCPSPVFVLFNGPVWCAQALLFHLCLEPFNKPRSVLPARASLNWLSVTFFSVSKNGCDRGYVQVCMTQFTASWVGWRGILISVGQPCVLTLACSAARKWVHLTVLWLCHLRVSEGAHWQTALIRYMFPYLFECRFVSHKTSDQAEKHPSSTMDL